MKNSIPIKRKKRGRPATGEMPFLGIRLPVDLIDAIDAWGERQKSANRSEAIRRLVQLGLKVKR